MHGEQFENTFTFTAQVIAEQQRHNGSHDIQTALERCITDSNGDHQPGTKPVGGEAT